LTTQDVERDRKRAVDMMGASIDYLAIDGCKLELFLCCKTTASPPDITRRGYAKETHVLAGDW
jgi:hypothetical protein